MTTPPPDEATATQIYEPVTTLTGTELRAVPQPPAKKKLKFDPPPGSRVAALMTELPRLEAEKKEADERLDECKKAIMGEIAATIENPEDMPDSWGICADPFGAWGGYNLTSSPGKLGLDTTALRTEEPQTYDRYTKRGKPFWTLSRVQTNRVSRGRK